MSALAQWRDERARGVRTTSHFDALWRAACAELNATEHAPIAAGIAQAEARLAALRLKSQRRDSLALACPALARWAREVLATARRRSPLEMVAAWEMTARLCEEAGDEAGAINAHHAIERWTETAA